MEITKRDTRQLGREVVDKVDKEMVDKVDNDMWLDIFFVGLSVFVAGAQGGDYSLEQRGSRHQPLYVVTTELTFRVFVSFQPKKLAKGY